jgi:HEAT repeat protein
VVAVCDSACEELGTALTQLKSANWEVRYHATKAIAEMGPTARDAIPALREALSDTESMVREGAAEALGAMGPEALPAAPELIRCLGNDLSLHRVASGALASIGPSVVPLLLNAPVEAHRAEEARVGPDAESSWDEMRGMEGLVMVPLIKLGASAVPGLKVGLNDSGPRTREVATDLLSFMAVNHVDVKVAVPSMARLLNDADASVRLAAIRGLGRLGTMAVDAAPELRRMLPSQDEYTTQEIQNALRLIEAPKPSPEKP